MTQCSLYTIRQKFDRPQCSDIEATVAAQIRGVGISLQPGAKIAVGVGSRGIANIVAIVKTTISCLKDAGAEPFIVPAMGSHGGATADGQTRVLAHLGITEAAVGAPIRSSMDTVTMPGHDLTNAIYCDRLAAEADGIVLVNRIKVHTSFHGDFESGLAKMAVIGLGKHAGALEIHSFGVMGLRNFIPATFRAILATGRILFGLGIIENAYDETAFIEAVPAALLLEREPRLLDIARKNMPKLPVNDIDVLIVDRLGKEISGVGMDPNIIGRIRIAGQPEPVSPKIRNIMVSNLSKNTYGNALGIGLADVITRKLFNAIDFKAMYVNASTSLFLERVKVPFVAESDAEAYTLALAASGTIEPGTERIVRIKDTLHLGTVQVSSAVLEEIREHVDLLDKAEPVFDANGALKPI
ncbi:MAG: DUF362 domain-containing protein [Chitinispirillaceae bacterium]|jgi:hypothetical protein|nr:DUF362 domain-containing protein [Chitinispirillaceae bacterium]